MDEHIVVKKLTEIRKVFIAGCGIISQSQERVATLRDEIEKLYVDIETVDGDVQDSLDLVDDLLDALDTSNKRGK